MTKKNIKYSKLKSKIYREATLKECFINDCNEKAIDAHSIQKQGALSILEKKINSNKCVYTLTETKLDENNELNFKPIGKKNASTFFGFCNFHDTNIFNEIENNSDLIDLSNLRHLFLLCFRAFSISYHRKNEDVNLFSTKNESTKENIKEYFKINNEGFDNYLSGSKLAVEDMNPQKDFLINCLKKEKYDSLIYYVYELKYPIKFTSTMLTSPPFLFSGEEINISEDLEFDYSDIISTVLPLENRSVVVLASFKDRPNGIKYLNELKSFNQNEKEIALTWHFLTNSENVFFDPIWIDKNIEMRKTILKLYEQSKSQQSEYLKLNLDKFDLNLFELSKK